MHVPSVIGIVDYGASVGSRLAARFALGFIARGSVGRKADFIHEEPEQLSELLNSYPQEGAIMSDSQPVYAGIDVSKATLDLARGQQGEVRRFANDCAAHGALGKALTGSASPVGLVVLEATGL